MPALYEPEPSQEEGWPRNHSIQQTQKLCTRAPGRGTKQLQAEKSRSRTQWEGGSSSPRKHSPWQKHF